MERRILSFLLALSLIICLLPATAFAAEPEPATAKIAIMKASADYTVEATEGGEPVYGKSVAFDGYSSTGAAKGTGWMYTQEGASANDWNFKFEYPKGGVPTLTLKDAKLVNMDASGNPLFTDNGDGTYTSTGTWTAVSPRNQVIDLKIVLQGENLVQTSNGIVRAAGSASNKFNSVTIIGEEGSSLTGDGKAIGIQGKYGVPFTIENANITLTTSSTYATAAPIYTEDANITIKNSTIKVTTTKGTVNAIHAEGSGVINVLNSDLELAATGTAFNKAPVLSEGWAAVAGDDAATAATATAAANLVAKYAKVTYPAPKPSTGATTAPTEQTTAPTVQTTAPTKQTTAPTEQTTAPTKQTTAPTVQTTAPTVQTTAPTVQTTAPTVQTTAPTVQTTAPTVQTTAPTVPTLASPYALKFGYASYELTNYDKPIYLKNGAVDTKDTAGNSFTAYVPASGSANDWNAKLEWKTGEAGPTLYLDGFWFDEFNDATGYWRYRGDGYPTSDHAQTMAITAANTAPLTIVLTGEDSLIETKFGISYNNALTIKSEGNAKLDMNLMSGGINGASGCALTLDANLDVDVATYYNTSNMVVSTTAADITINGGNLNLTGTGSLVAMCTKTSGSIHINGGNVYAKGGYRGMTVFTETDNININGGSATIVGSYSAIYKGGVKGTPTIPADAKVEILTGSMVDGSNAVPSETVVSASYIKITYIDAAQPTYPTAGVQGSLSFKLNTDGSSYSVSDCDDTVSGALSIPNAFYGLPVTGIVYPAFYRCNGLTNVAIPDSVTSIGSDAFRYCTGLTNVTIPDSVTSIGSYAFHNCYNLTNVTIGSGVTSIGSYAFYYCTGLTNVTIPDSVTSIGSSAFYHCTGLTSVTIPDSVTGIGSSAFYYCTDLTNVTIGSGVTSIGSSAFRYCDKLTGIWVDENNPNYSSDSNGVLFNRAKTTLIQAPGRISGEYAIPDSVTSIGSYAFYDCNNLTDVTIPDSVTGIGSSAFKYCTGLTNVTIGSGVTSIGDSAFSYCTSLTNVAIPDSFTSIGSNAFYYCYNLTNVAIPDSVTSIGSSAFRYCNKLTGIWVDENNPNYSSDSNGVLFNKAKTTLIQAPGGISGEYTIPESVTFIGTYAFEHCTGLTNVAIPDSVTSIGNGAFRSGNKLTGIWVDENNPNYSSDSNGVLFNKAKTTLIQAPGGISGEYTIPESVTFIGTYAFEHCTGLTNVAIPDSVTSIGSNAFYYCYNLTNVAIPDSVTSIGSSAFAYCFDLANVYYAGTQAQWDAITVNTGNTDLLNATLHLESDGIPPTEATTAPTTAPTVQTTAPTVAPSAPTEATTAPTTSATFATQPSIRFGLKTFKLAKYDTPVYLVNASAATQDTAGNTFTKWVPTTSGADESNYNAKFVWNSGDETPTLILRGFKYDEWNNETGLMEAKFDNSTGEYTTSAVQTYSITTDKNVPLTIILTGEDSLIECKFGITYYNNLTIKSEGNTKLVMNNQSSCISPNNTAGATLTIDANLDLTVGNYYNAAFNHAVIHTYQADLIINGGTITAKTTATKIVTGISARNGGNLIINGGDITATSVLGTNATNGTITATGGKLIINGGTVKVAPKSCVGLYGKTGIVMNGGIVNIVSPYYGLNVGTTDAPAEFKFNGGTMTIMAERACCSGAEPVLGDNVFAYVGAGPKSAKIYDGSDPTLARKPWMKLTNDPDEKLEAKVGLLTLLKYGDGYSVTVCDPAAVGEIVIPAEVNGLPVTTIVDDAFQGCTGITSVVLPEGITEIGDAAFYGCIRLENISIPKTLARVGNAAFNDCGSLQNVYISDLAAWCGIYFYSYSTTSYSNPLYWAENLYLNGELVTDVVIPETVTNLTYRTFHNYDKLESVTIPDCVTGIGSQTFAGCGALTDVTIGDGVVGIGYEAFSGCGSLTNVTIGDGVMSIESSAFSNCYNMKSVLMSNSIETIETNAFWNCDNLETVYFKGSQADWDWIIFESGNDYLKNAKVIFNYPGDVNPDQEHNVEILPYKAPTCTENGLTEGLWCADCHEIIMAQTVIPATGIHIEQIIPGVPACTGNGLTEGVKCIQCGQILVAQEKLPLAAHTVITISAVAPTCTTAGITECQYCMACESVLTPMQVIPPVGHSEIIIPGRAPTCSEYGLTEGKMCAICGEILVAQQYISKLPHTTEIIPGYAATCTEDGLTEGVKCTVCGEILTPQYAIPALGHKEVPVAALAPTCTTNGNTAASFCYVCHKLTVMPQFLPALGHTEVVTPGKAATCTEAGLTEGKHCATCGEILAVQTEIPAYGHTEKTVAGKAATCTATGLTEGKMCTVCGGILVAQEEIPALGHQLFALPGQAPTCTQTGSTEGQYCLRCVTMIVVPEIVPATGHTYDNAMDAECNACGAVRQTSVSLDFVNYRVVFSDSDTTHKNHRAIVYKLGDQTVADPSDEKALKAIDPNAVTHWQANVINKLVITDAGNYVILLKFNVGTATVSVPMAITVADVPKLLIDNNNKMTILDADETHINHRVNVYYIGENTVEDIYDVNALKAIDAAPETVWQKSAINKLALTKGGTYVLHYQYNIGTSAAYTVAQTFTVEAIPALKIDQNNMFIASDDNAGNTNHRVTIFTMGENTVEDIFDEKAVAAAAVSSRTVWGLSEINKIEITEAGNYIVQMYYNIPSGAKRTIAVAATLYERPVLTVTDENKLNASYADAAVITNPRVTYYYFGETSTEGLDLYNATALKAAATKVSSTIWTQNTINKTILTDRGNYVIHLDYNEKVGTTGSVKKTVAIATTVYDPTKPTVTLGEGNMLVAANSNVDATNIRATIYKLGEETVENIYDEAALKAIDSAAVTKWGLSEINKVQLADAGNYVILVKYNLGTSTRTVAYQFAV